MKKLDGSECFVAGDKSTDMTVLDVWKYHFCNRFNMHEYFGEFLVAKALGIEESYNSDYWRLYDINYRGKRIEVKTSSYYHAFKEHLNTNISERRVFGITKAYSDYKDKNSSYERQNDIYVFCLNTGKTPESSDPLDLNNWKFYVVPTKVINEECGDAKTISIQKIRKLGFEGVGYFEIKERIDNLVDDEEKYNLEYFKKKWDKETIFTHNPTEIELKRFGGLKQFIWADKENIDIYSFSDDSRLYHLGLLFAMRNNYDKANEYWNKIEHKEMLTVLVQDF